MQLSLCGLTLLLAVAVLQVPFLDANPMLLAPQKTPRIQALIEQFNKKPLPPARPPPPVPRKDVLKTSMPPAPLKPSITAVSGRRTQVSLRPPYQLRKETGLARMPRKFNMDAKSQGQSAQSEEGLMKRFKNLAYDLDRYGGWVKLSESMFTSSPSIWLTRSDSPEERAARKQLYVFLDTYVRDVLKSLEEYNRPELKRTMDVIQIQKAMRDYFSNHWWIKKVLEHSELQRPADATCFMLSHWAKAFDLLGRIGWYDSTLGSNGQPIGFVYDYKNSLTARVMETYGKYTVEWQQAFNAMYPRLRGLQDSLDVVVQSGLKAIGAAVPLET